jgi:hypothetical protein
MIARQALYHLSHSASPNPELLNGKLYMPGFTLEEQA